MKFGANSRNAGRAGGASCSPTPPAQQMLKEAFRANGWQASVDALAVYSLERMKTARPETIKAMHDKLQAVCGELWKGIEP